MGALMHKLISTTLLCGSLAATSASVTPALAASPIFGKANVASMSAEQNKQVTGKYAGSVYAYYGYVYSYNAYLYGYYHYYYGGSTNAYYAYSYAYSAYINSYYAYLGY
jgi:hypothetical protein